jgi:hypothetical protein
MKLWNIIDSVAFVYANQGVTTFDAGCQVITVARELGYPAPLDSGIWVQDLPALLRTVAVRLGEGAR